MRLQTQAVEAAAAVMMALLLALAAMVVQVSFLSGSRSNRGSLRTSN
jgi:hypothetical protein